MMFALGGPKVQAEAQRMVTEKMLAAARESAGRIALSPTPDEQKRRFAKVCERLDVVHAPAANDG